MLNFNSIIVFSEDPKNLSEFYTKVFEKEPDWSGGDFVGWKVGDGYFTLGPHDKVKGENESPERMIVNFETEEVEEEFGRIKELGAKVVAEPYHPAEVDEGMIATFADPDGNFFQLMSPMPS